MKNKGITLITLVITIIILLILIGITINMLFGNNGIITKTENSKIQYEQQETREKINLVLSSAQIEKQTNPQYNKNEWLDQYILTEIPGSKIQKDGENDMIVIGEWEFLLNRNVPKIEENIGKIEPLVYYFEISTDNARVESFPRTINVIVKNNDGSNYNEEDIKYTLEIDNPNYTFNVSGGNTRTLKGGNKQEETFAVTINKIGDITNEQVDLIFNISMPYKEKKRTPIKIVESDTFTFDFNEKIDTFDVIWDGTYKLETWGAQGGNNGGYGGYSVGNVVLKKDELLYIVVGSEGKKDGKRTYNGGGKGNPTYAGCGGGATHIAKLAGLLSSLSNNKDSLLIVSAGGGGTSETGNKGGNGGGYKGTDGSGEAYTGKGAIHDTGGAGGAGTAKTGTFGQGGDAEELFEVPEVRFYAGGGGRRLFWRRRSWMVKKQIKSLWRRPEVQAI